MRQENTTTYLRRPRASRCRVGIFSIPALSFPAATAGNFTMHGKDLFKIHSCNKMWYLRNSNCHRRQSSIVPQSIVDLETLVADQPSTIRSRDEYVLRRNASSTISPYSSRAVYEKDLLGSGTEFGITTSALLASKSIATNIYFSYCHRLG
jgi:hypothetical protein